MKLILPGFLMFVLFSCSEKTQPEESNPQQSVSLGEEEDKSAPVFMVKDNGVATWKIYLKEITSFEYEVAFKSLIDEGWHIYAVNLPSDEGPLPTVFEFALPDGMELMGEVEEGKAIRKFDHNFGVEVMYFEKEAIFKQRIKITEKEAILKGNISYMACDSERCIPPVDVPFELVVN